jgi:hypothetical protein
MSSAANVAAANYHSSRALQEAHAVGKYEELHRSSTTTTAALLSSPDSKGHLEACLSREADASGYQRVSGSRSGARTGRDDININTSGSDGTGVLIKQQNHHGPVTSVSGNDSTEMNRSEQLSIDRQGYSKHLKNHVVSNGAVVDPSRISHQTAVIYNGKQYSTVLTTAYKSQQKSTAKSLVGSATVASNGASNGATSAVTQTKISKGAASSVVLKPFPSQKPYLPNGVVNSSAEQAGYGRHQPVTSARTHQYSGQSVVDFLYGGLDGHSAGGSSPTSLLGSGGASGNAGSGYYSESKYAYSVSGVPGTLAQSSAAAAFFAR